MAEIVLGIGTSHSPGMTLPAERWERSRTGDLVDIQQIDYRGQVYSYADLLALRESDYLTEQNTLQQRQFAFARVQECLLQLSRKLDDVRPDVLVVIGDDHMEFFVRTCNRHLRFIAVIQSSIEGWMVKTRPN